MGEPVHPADVVELQDERGLARSDLVHHGTLDASDIPPQHAVSALPKWNQNQAHVFKTLSTFIAFIIMGANDAAYGVSISLPDREEEKYAD